MDIQRAIVAELSSFIKKGPPFLQIVIVPRHVGKTTVVLQAVKSLGWASVIASADEAVLLGPEWIEMQ